MPRPPIDGGRILITGASAGIGEELARVLAPRARSLILVARRAERLATLREELLGKHPRLEVICLTADLADPEAPASVAAAAGEVDVLVNNAGLGYQARFDRVDPECLERLLAVDVLALVRLTRLLLPGMVSRGRGGILNIGSGAGYAPMLDACLYVGAKHFVIGFSEALRLEVEGTGVVVTNLSPGPVHTEFRDAAGIDPAAPGPPGFLAIGVEQCVREGLAGFDRGRDVVFPGFLFRTLMRLMRFCPRALVHWVVASRPR